MYKKIIRILISLLVLGCYIYFMYFFTDFGFRKEVTLVSGTPIWFNSIIGCFFIPLLTYLGLKGKFK